MIEVEEYVRYEGNIAKVRKNNDGLLELVLNDGSTRGRFEEEIEKYSKNIIDLIEVGDIVHIKDVLNEDIVYIWDEEFIKAVREDLEAGIELVEILTHEQFEKNNFKVE